MIDESLVPEYFQRLLENPLYLALLVGPFLLFASLAVFFIVNRKRIALKEAQMRAEGYFPRFAILERIVLSSIMALLFAVAIPLKIFVDLRALSAL